MKKAKKEYERIETFYEGENGPPWVAYLNAKTADGWELAYAKTTKRIDEKRFRAKVAFRREVKP